MPEIDVDVFRGVVLLGVVLAVAGIYFVLAALLGLRAELHRLAASLRGAQDEEPPSTTRRNEPEVTAPVTAQASDDAVIHQNAPYERDGKWWFKRGDDLLVYDASTGQWIAAGGTSEGPDGSEIKTDAEAATEEAAGVAVAAETSESPAEKTTFWRCPACSAVNVSSAVTCRMCFAARP